MTREDATKILADLIDSPFLHTWEKQNKALHMAIEALSERTGEWIYSTKQLEIVPMWECSCCRIRAAKKFNFCPNCGARMLNGGEQDGNV